MEKGLSPANPVSSLCLQGIKADATVFERGRGGALWDGTTSTKGTGRKDRVPSNKVSVVPTLSSGYCSPSLRDWNLLDSQS